MYEYNGAGQRIAVTTGGVTKRFCWDVGWNVLDEENGSGVLTRTMVLEDPDSDTASLLADIEGSNPVTGTARFYNGDQLGSTRSLYDSSKAALGTYDFVPYGETYATTGTVALSGLSAAFTGKPFDAASGLYYFPFRHYNPETSRWLSRDPLGMVDGPNIYAYVGNDPVNEIDPLGLDWLDNAADTAAGYGDYITGGLTGWIRHQMGTDDYVNKCSSWYKGGEAAGVAWDMAFRRATPVGSVYAIVGGETKYARYGRDIHKAYNYEKGFKKNMRLPSGRIPDAVNRTIKVVLELKPNNPRAIRRGERQLQRYIDELNKMFGGGFTGRVITYDRW